MNKKPTASSVLEHIGTLCTMDPALGSGSLGIRHQAAVAMHDGRIVWVGPEAELDAQVTLSPDCDRLSAAGRVVLPGLVDCHTHLVFGGGREHEFALRVAGASYQDIAAAGGGIASTMRDTRAASFDTLLDLGLKRLEQGLRHGITTCEVKSGYGLSVDDELKLLEVAQMLGQTQPVRVVSTFLGAHTIPPEWRHDRARYLSLVIDELLPQVAERDLATFCDVFCEQGAFSVAESRAVLTRAAALGLQLKVHADQLSDSGGSLLAAELGAVSADHLEYTSPSSMAAMRDAGTVAVLLPGAAFFLGQTFPDARRYLDAGLKVAIATDFNPGSSPTHNPLLVGTIAAVRMHMPPDEALRALTVGGAQALGLDHEVGRVSPGYCADLAVFDVTDHRSLLYRFGANLCAMVIKDGDVVVP